MKIKLPDNSVRHEVAEGDGPVGALDAALRKALDQAYPSLRDLRLVDFKVRVVDGASEGTSASIRVTVESACKQTGDLFSTIGVSTNIIEVRPPPTFSLHLLHNRAAWVLRAGTSDGATHRLHAAHARLCSAVR